MTMVRNRFAVARAWRLAGTMLVVLLAACVPRSFDRALGEEPVYFDQATPEQRDAAARMVGDGLLRGSGTYRLQPGDRVEVFYHTNNQRLRPYRIGIGDELELDFDFNRDLNRQMVVRPDGMISLPGKGEIRALGQTPAELSAEVARRFSDVARTPVVTVIVRRFTTPAEDLAEVVRNGADGRARTALVRPDGVIDLPLAQGIQAAGMTLDELRATLNARYAREVGGVTVTARLTQIGANQIFVFGEVRQAGAIPAPSPRTLLQLVAAAGGPMPTGAMDQVRVLYFDAVGRPRVRQVNLERVLNDLAIEEDMVVPPNATVWIPPTDVARVGRFVDQVIRQIFLFNGTSISFNYGNSFRFPN
ncbi:polysaccharide biosynthesis/export family protein [Roseomonas sp. CAU 1739]|uniref:polysaccharide biosynthesis/export family protein n=1 Tax=Roseomonas sp. CAU 1739 TaxID=3140364 RepID=UPI00325C0862